MKCHVIKAPTHDVTVVEDLGGINIIQLVPCGMPPMCVLAVRSDAIRKVQGMIVRNEIMGANWGWLGKQSGKPYIPAMWKCRFCLSLEKAMEETEKMVQEYKRRTWKTHEK